MSKLFADVIPRLCRILRIVETDAARREFQEVREAFGGTGGLETLDEVSEEEEFTRYLQPASGALSKRQLYAALAKVGLAVTPTEQLRIYARRFPCVEVDTSTYAIPLPATVAEVSAQSGTECNEFAGYTQPRDSGGDSRRSADRLVETNYGAVRTKFSR